jgi:hypothetical protein
MHIKMSSDRAEICGEIHKGTFQLQSSSRGVKAERIRDLKEKRNQFIVKILHSTLNPNPLQTPLERLFQEKTYCVYITQFTDQIIQYKAAIASENFWEEQRKNNSSK